MLVCGGPPTLGIQRSAGSSLSLIVFALAAASGLYRLANVAPGAGAGAGPLRGVPIRPPSSAGSRPVHQTPVRSGLPSAVRGTGPSGFQAASCAKAGGAMRAAVSAAASSTRVMDSSCLLRVRRAPRADNERPAVLHDDLARGPHRGVRVSGPRAL